MTTKESAALEALARVMREHELEFLIISGDHMYISVKDHLVLHIDATKKIGSNITSEAIINANTD